MSESDAYKVVTASILWHLTPDGWVKGASSDEDGKRYEGDIPIDRFATFRYSTKGSEMSGKVEDVAEVWRSDDAPVVEQLLQQHGDCPRRFWSAPDRIR